MYVFDTNSLSVLFDNFYPDRFPSLWEKFDQLIINSEIVSVREVYNEIKRRNCDARLVQWAKDHRGLFTQPSVEEMWFVRGIFSVPRFRDLIRKKQMLKGTPVADPFLIVRAHVGKGVLVTEERWKPSGAKIPNVCEHFKVQYMNLQGFMSREKWQF